MTEDSTAILQQQQMRPTLQKRSQSYRLSSIPKNTTKDEEEQPTNRHQQKEITKFDGNLSAPLLNLSRLPNKDKEGKADKRAALLALTQSSESQRRIAEGIHRLSLRESAAAKAVMNLSMEFETSGEFDLDELSICKKKKLEAQYKESRLSKNSNGIDTIMSMSLNRSLLGFGVENGDATDDESVSLLSEHSSIDSGIAYENDDINSFSSSDNESDNDTNDKSNRTNTIEDNMQEREDFLDNLIEGDDCDDEDDNDQGLGGKQLNSILNHFNFAGPGNEFDLSCITEATTENDISRMLDSSAITLNCNEQQPSGEKIVKEKPNRRGRKKDSVDKKDSETEKKEDKSTEIKKKQEKSRSHSNTRRLGKSLSTFENYDSSQKKKQKDKDKNKESRGSRRLGQSLTSFELQKSRSTSKDRHQKKKEEKEKKVESAAISKAHQRLGKSLNSFGDYGVSENVSPPSPSSSNNATGRNKMRGKLRKSNSERGFSSASSGVANSGSGLARASNHGSAPSLVAAAEKEAAASETKVARKQPKRAKSDNPHPIRHNSRRRPNRDLTSSKHEKDSEICDKDSTAKPASRAGLRKSRSARLVTREEPKSWEGRNNGGKEAEDPSDSNGKLRKKKSSRSLLRDNSEELHSIWGERSSDNTNEVHGQEDPSDSPKNSDKLRRKKSSRSLLKSSSEEQKEENQEEEKSRTRRVPARSVSLQVKNGEGGFAEVGRKIPTRAISLDTKNRKDKINGAAENKTKPTRPKLTKKHSSRRLVNRSQQDSMENADREQSELSKTKESKPDEHNITKPTKRQNSSGVKKPKREKSNSQKAPRKAKESSSSRREKISLKKSEVNKKFEDEIIGNDDEIEEKKSGEESAVVHDDSAPETARRSCTSTTESLYSDYSQSESSCSYDFGNYGYDAGASTTMLQFTPDADASDMVSVVSLDYLDEFENSTNAKGGGLLDTNQRKKSNNDDCDAEDSDEKNKSVAYRKLFLPLAPQGNAPRSIFHLDDDDVVNVVSIDETAFNSKSNMLNLCEQVLVDDAFSVTTSDVEAADPNSCSEDSGNKERKNGKIPDLLQSPAASKRRAANPFLNTLKTGLSATVESWTPRGSKVKIGSYMPSILINNQGHHRVNDLDSGEF